jgi:hypothetical protein
LSLLLPVGVRATQVRTGAQQSPYIEELKKAEEHAQAAGLGVWTKVRGCSVCVLEITNSFHARCGASPPVSGIWLYDAQDATALQAAVRNVPSVEGAQPWCYARTHARKPHAHKLSQNLPVTTQINNLLVMRYQHQQYPFHSYVD